MILIYDIVIERMKLIRTDIKFVFIIPNITKKVFQYNYIFLSKM